MERLANRLRQDTEQAGTLPALYVAAQSREQGAEWIAAVAAATERKPAGVKNWLYGNTRPNKDIRRRLSALFGIPEEKLFPARN